jgi:fructokinase
VRIETRGPEETVTAIVAAVRACAERGRLEACGVASFGPLAKADGRFAAIARTPKPGWSGTPTARMLEDALQVPVALDTDVNAAAIAEGRFGAARGLADFAYVTVGSGIGVGLVANGAPVHGLGHPEAGHIGVRRDVRRDPFTGCCPFHGDCLEGLASGPAVAARLGRAAETCAPDDPIWPLIGDYGGQLVATLALVAAPRCVILGGGVGSNPALAPHVRVAASSLLGGYLDAADLGDGLSAYVRAPSLGDKSGLIGAFVLGAARAALR